jgi:RNA polymerase sigma factor (sigma-70 family)
MQLMNTDEKLWMGLKQGDKEMFLILYKRYYHTLLFIGLKQIKDAALVKDTIQQIFLYIWEKRETIGEAQNIKSYLVSSFLRKLSVDQKKYKSTSPALWNINSEDPQPNPEDKLIKKDQDLHSFNFLTHLINNLPLRQKELIVLKFYEGLSYHEIVERTGLSHRTVYNKIHEGLKKLKQKITAGQKTRNAKIILLITILVPYSTITFPT